MIPDNTNKITEKITNLLKKGEITTAIAKLFEISKKTKFKKRALRLSARYNQVLNDKIGHPLDIHLIEMNKIIEESIEILAQIEAEGDNNIVEYKPKLMLLIDGSIDEFDNNKRQLLQKIIAGIVNIPESEVKILHVLSGSIFIIIQLSLVSALRFSSSKIQNPFIKHKIKVLKIKKIKDSEVRSILLQKGKGVFLIQGITQHYDWGGQDFIPNLIKQANSQKQPFAELWMGAHERGPAIINTSRRTLADYIAELPQEILGNKVAQSFNKRLPFLFKVLDVGSMLSIQSHPTKQQAEIGFAKEEAAGIPIKARHRNFRDDNHKPEIMVALTEFWLLHGFRAKNEVATLLRQIPEFAPLRPYFQEENIHILYEYLMTMAQAEVDRILEPLDQRLSKQDCPKDTPDYWARQAFEQYTRDGHYDRGIFSIYLLNLVRLEIGDGIFQAAGVPHAYLEGVNVELMANSDNVFRGGLTPKHIDPPKLLQHLRMESVNPKILKGEQISTSERVYRTPAPDFELSRLDIAANQSHERCVDAPDTLLVLKGEVEVQSSATTFSAKRGDVFFACANSPYTITAKEDARLYRASVPV